MTQVQADEDYRVSAQLGMVIYNLAEPRDMYLQLFQAPIQ